MSSAQNNYDANLKKIPWNTSISNNLASSRQNSNGAIDTNLPIFVNLVENEARGASGAAGQRSRARQQVDTAINNLKSVPLAIDGYISRIDIGGIQNSIKAVEQQIAAEKSKQSKSNEILELRKEQSVVLEKKYSANLHSSWLGLWRPLKDESHVGLNVASAMFGLLALLAIGYLGYAYFSAPATAGANSGGSIIPEAVATGAKNIFAGLTGGFRKVKSSHK